MPAATRADIARWINEGTKNGSRFVIVAVDQFDWSDYPIYVKRGENPREVWAAHKAKQNMVGLMECYDLDMDIETQLNAGRCHNWGDSTNTD